MLEVPDNLYQQRVKPTRDTQPSFWPEIENMNITQGIWQPESTSGLNSVAAIASMTIGSIQINVGVFFRVQDKPQVMTR